MPALRRPKRLRHRRRNLYVSDILAWADAFQRKHGRWPRRDDGPVDEAPDLTWCAIDQALRKGGRCLPTGSGWSLAQLLAERRGVRNKKQLPDFTIKQILTWADAYHRRTGQWPNCKSGPIDEAPGETWLAVDKALRNGTRGMTGPSSLALLLAARRGIRNNTNIPKLLLRLVLVWADAYFKRHGRWPTRKSGPVAESPGETWYAIDAAFHQSNRGLVGYISLAHFLAVKRGHHYRLARPDLTIEQILEWARTHFQYTGHWPNHMSGPVLDAPGETWGGIHAALVDGRRGLPKSTLYRVLSLVRASGKPAHFLRGPKPRLRPAS